MLKSNSKLSLLVVSDTLNERESKNKMNGQYIDIIFLALIAAVLIYRLARVLGSEVDENKDNNTEQKNEIRENTQDNVVSMAMHGQKEFVGALAAYDEEETKKDPIKAVFYKNHLDYTPLGDIVSTVITLIQGHPEIDFYFKHKTGEKTVELDTRQLKLVLEDVPLNSYEVLCWIKEYLLEQYIN